MVNPNALVSCRNVSIISRYVRQQIGSDFLLFQNLPFSAEYLCDDDHWVSLELYNTVMERAIDVLNDPKAPYEIGCSTQRLSSWGRMEYLERILGSLLLGPVAAYGRVPRYNRLFNRTKEMEMWYPEHTHCFIKIKFINDVNPLDDFYSDPYIRGIIASVPEIWDLPPAQVTRVLSEYDIEDLLVRVGGVSKRSLRWKGNTLFLRGEEVGMRVRLIPEPTLLNGQVHYLGKYEYIDEDHIPEHVPTGVLISTNRTVGEMLTLSAGEIHNAPYFLHSISWEPLPFFRKIWRLIRKSMDSKRVYLEAIESSLETIRHYVETLEDQVLERTEALNQAKIEAEFWRRKAEDLLDTMLPEEIVTKMMQGKLVPQESVGTVLYSDLAGFTAFSKELEPAEVVKVLHAYFTEMSDIASEYGGWINKFLGDGILIMFGLGKEGEQQAPLHAVQAALEMQKRMEKYPWTMRIGIATGPFITGEFGSDKLRRFDAIGHTMNLGSRLEKEAHAGEVMVCPRTYDAVRSLYKGKEHTVTPKGLGAMHAYSISI